MQNYVLTKIYKNASANRP